MVERAGPTSLTKQLFIKTYGCQMNVYDSERMVDLLSHHGYETTDQASDADLVVLNTCHIRERAAEKVYSELGRLEKMRSAKKDGTSPMIAVAGCVAQAESDAMATRAPFIDIIFGPQTIHRLPELLEKRRRSDGTVLDTDFPEDTKFDHLLDGQNKVAASSFLSVQEGCDKFCSFCVVPYTRGAEQSRPVDAVMAEARNLVRRGAKELVLLGQNVNAYHGDLSDGRTCSLAGLLDRLADIDGVERLRYTTSHPRDMSADLIACHGYNTKLMPYLHLPVQAGSDAVLKSMNRGHTAEEYLRTIEQLRDARPDMAFSSDFIVGFPGETDEHFEDTLRLVEQVNYTICYSFKYSRRPGTPGSVMPKQVNEATKSERLSRLQALLNQQADAFNQACVGQQMTVMIERDGRHPGQKAARSPYMQMVILDTDLPIGTLVDVMITGCNAHTLRGELVLPGTGAHSSGMEQTQSMIHG